MWRAIQISNGFFCGSRTSSFDDSPREFESGGSEGREEDHNPGLHSSAVYSSASSPSSLMTYRGYRRSVLFGV